MYVRFRDKHDQVFTREIDDHRLVDEDSDGVVGIELLFVSTGVKLDGLPHSDEVRELNSSLRKISEVS